MNYQLLLYDAIAFNQVEVVKELLKQPKVDASDDNNYAIRMASAYGHIYVVKRLAKDSKVIKKAKKLNQTYILSLITKYQ